MSPRTSDHNARINPAGGIVSSLQALRMTGKLIPLGFNES
ncbi:MAG: hypothetical protein QOJ64_2178, partial [Acidobacteriota bacterium]|nr:hypothetical protein [Acidobacteriota bacterium]